MKVLFIVPYPTEGPSNRFRVEQYFPYLKQEGVSFTLRPFYNRFIYRILYKKGNYLLKAFWGLFFLCRRIKDVLSCLRYDVVFIHREAYPFSGYFYERLFRIFGKKIIYDFDDSIFLTKPAKIINTIRSSDCVIAGNNFLRDYALRYNKKVFLLPTCIDTDVYRPRAQSIKGGKVVIGWMGSFFTSVYLDILKEVYWELTQKFKDKVEFRVIGGVFSDVRIPLVCRDWSLDSEVGQLQEFDIGVMPLFDDQWARGKCGFKIIEYMAVGIPSVASGIGVNVQIISDGQDGYLVNSGNEWVARLSSLIENKELREEMGKKSRAKAEKLYSIQGNSEKFLGMLEGVLKAKI